MTFDAVTAAKARGREILIVDTAGRLHTRANLMAELDKIRRVVGREVQGAPHEVLLVLDATVGQNGLVQAREFMAASGANGIVLTKLDGTAKGGVAVAIAHDLKLPIRYVGVGEGLDDLVPFDAADVRGRALHGQMVDASRRRALHGARAVPRRARPRHDLAQSDRRRRRRVRRRRRRRAGRAPARRRAARGSRRARRGRRARPRRDAYCTLEPCAHTGRTGPCVERIVAAGITRVVAAMTDPNPRVSGAGLRVPARARHRGAASVSARTQARRQHRAVLHLGHARPAVRDRQGRGVGGWIRRPRAASACG